MTSERLPSLKMPHLIQATCTKCGACLTECPTASIIAGAKQFHIDVDSCDDTGACVLVCPVDAITPLLSEQALEDSNGDDSKEEE